MGMDEDEWDRQMRVAICDDELAIRELTYKYLTEWGRRMNVRIQAENFPTGEAFLFAWDEDEDFDLLILDIEMGEDKMSGMELARAIRKKDESLPILFITGYEQYMAQGYEVDAIHYLIKPVSKEKLFQALDKVHRRMKESGPEKKLLLQTTEGNISVPVGRILYMEAEGHRTLLHENEKTHTLKHSITEIETMLVDCGEMMRCHRAYIVNLKNVSAIVKNEIIMDNGDRILSSRSLTKAVNTEFVKQNRG